MRLGIDAANIRTGGAVTHLSALLGAASPAAHGFSKTIVWSNGCTLGRIQERPWLVKQGDRMLERSLLWRSYWQRFCLPKLVREAECDVLFVPGGSYGGRFQPVVTMCQNTLPFDRREAKRYGLSAMGLRLRLLRWTQLATLSRAAGVIFLSEYARRAITGVAGALGACVETIPHGIDHRFLHEPREQRDLAYYTPQRPLRAIYVSTIDLYKHQWHVAEAVVALRAQGIPIVLDLVGGAYPPALARLRQTLSRIDPAGAVVRYLGPISHDKLHETYLSADLGIFASSCENLPNILIECMASGLPIACSNRGPMPEVLADGGVYFDPESSGDIATALRTLALSPELRERTARMAFVRAHAYSWNRCASNTLEFLAGVARRV
jgi:glycosyltransferase involved in cell wall biosynthesis